VLEGKLKGNIRNLKKKWLGPFQVVLVQDNNTYKLAQLDGEIFVAPMNGRFVKNFLQY
jgi:hypothetical protein